MRAQSYRDLLVWQRGIDLVAETYRLARTLPNDERFGLRSQMCRAAVSVPANIAEGNGRFHRGDYLHHISIARGSLTELDTHIQVGRRLNYFDEQQVKTLAELIDHVSRMLHRLAVRLRDRRGGPPPASRLPPP
jgi:four helix bundle protein